MKRQRLLILVLASLATIALIALFGWNASGRAEEGSPILKYPDFPPTPTIAQPPTNGPRVAGATLYSEQFDSPDALTKWEFVDEPDLLPEDRGVWAVENGALVQNRTGNAGNPSTEETMAMTGDVKWTDYTVSIKAYDQNNATFGLVARRQGNSFYRYRIIANGYEAKTKQTLEKVVNGVVTPLATTDSPGYEQRQWHNIALSVAGAQIRVTLDGKVVAEVTDSTLASGQAGLYTRALGGIRFDDFLVAAP
jgi:Domain of Unknown Function (DUF1080)